ncbi:MAG TPA: sigma-54 dependent transcriptional regulator, partial [Humisphaera sp.]
PDPVAPPPAAPPPASPPPSAPLRVLVVDDEPNIRRALLACLTADGHEPTAVASAAEALAAAGRRSFDLAFVDLNLGPDRGLDLIPALLVESPWLKVVVLTAHATLGSAVECMRRGAADYLPKPFTPDQLSVVTQKVAAVRALEQRVAALQDAAGEAGPEADLASRSPAVQRAVALARQVADSDATVLIRGESGTGKGVLARAVHGWSGRAGKPFGVVACPSLSAELLESELFGHVRGAFTGAVRDNPGRIAATAGGTLFLDEVGDLPPRLQPKLLRFVQDREYERVGDHATRRADVRIVAATNVDLEQAVRDGRFREDLLYRLNVVQVTLPPLRERAEDVVPLAERLLAWFGRKRPGGPPALDPAAAEALRAYAWPGNVRELRNVVERAAILCGRGPVRADHLMLGPAGTAAAARPGVPQVGDPVPLERIEELHIRGVLATAPSIDEAARVLGMDTVTLWRRRKRYGI